MDDKQFGQLSEIVLKWLTAPDASPHVRVEAANVPARTLLILGDPESALRLLGVIRPHVDTGIPLMQDERYMVLANEAYCHIALGRRATDPDIARAHFTKARDLILRIKDIQGARRDGVRIYDPWHALALAEAFRELGSPNFEVHVEEAAEMGDELQNRYDHYVELYPQLRGAIERSIARRRT